MKKSIKLLLLNIVVVLIGCVPSPSSSDSGVPYSPAIITETTTAPAWVNDPGELHLIARGKKGSWSCQFYEHRILFVYNFGKDTLLAKEGATRNEDEFPPILYFYLPNYDLAVDINHEARKNLDFSKADSVKITIKHGQKEYNGYVRKAEK